MRSNRAVVLTVLALLTNQFPAIADSWQQLYDNANQALSIESFENAQRLFEQGLKAGPAGDKAQEVLMRAGLAEALLWQGKFPEAAKQFKAVIKRIDDVGDKPDAASIYDAYSWLLQAQGKTAESATFARKALEIRQRLLPANCELTAQSLEHLAALSEQQGLLKDALDLYGQALAMRQQIASGQEVPIANLTEKLAIIQNRLGNRDMAARLFNESLNEKTSIGAIFQPYSPHSAWQTVMYRFAQGAPNCSRDAVSGESLASISTPDNVIVQATVLPASDFKGATAFVRVINNGHHQIDFLPRPPVLVELTPNVQLAKVLNTDSVADQIEKKGNRKASMIRFWQGNATTSVTSTIVTNPGCVRPGWGWGCPYPARNFGPQTSMVTTQVPDFEARARAEAKAQAVTQKAMEAAELLRDQKLLATNLRPGQMTQGCVQFDATNIKDGIFRIGVGNAMFEFPLGQN